nr:substrate-binding domain-containing protein [Bifidobacterium jacchi]
MLQRGVDGILVIRDGSEPQPSLSALRMIGDPRSSGISSGGIGSSGTDDISDIGSGTRTPFVYAFGPSDDPADRSVVCDNIEAGRAAVAHLVSCGRRHIAIIGGGETSTATADRVSGALAALESYDLKPAGPIRYGVPDETWGRAAIRLLIDQGVEFDAVICHSDRLARGCMEVLERRRMRVPQDVAVVGYGDRAEFTQTVRPALTSIDPNLRGVGARAAQRLIEAINAVRETAAATAATATAGVEAVECRLIQRGSTLPIG